MTDNSMDLARARFDVRALLARTQSRPTKSRSAGTWLAVLLIHLVFLALFVISVRTAPSVPHAAEQEILLSFQQTNPETAPPLPALRSAGPRPVPEIHTAPITLPPMVPLQLQPTDRDILRAIGEALACGASSYENLPEMARENCLYIPWIPMRAPNGEIVLAPKTPATGPVHLSGAQTERRQLETAPPCPMLSNAPCLGRVFTGEGNTP